MAFWWQFAETVMGVFVWEKFSFGELMLLTGSLKQIMLKRSYWIVAGMMSKSSSVNDSVVIFYDYW